MAKRKKKKTRKKTRFRPGFFLPLLGLAILILWVIFQPAKHEVPENKTMPEDARRVSPEGPRAPEAPVPRHLKIAILIDDIGQDLKPLDELLRIDAPIAFSILPFRNHSVAAARKIHEKGREVLLHLPMEPLDYPERNPGEGALLTAMNEREIRSQVEKDLMAVPFACGVNNHMGSRFMQDGKKLKVLFGIIRDRDLYFIDSVTTASSRAAEIADETAVRFASRNFFIDHAADKNRVFRNLEGLLKKKGNGESLLVIGHPYPETIQALKTYLPRLRAKGFEFIPLPRLIHENGASRAVRQTPSQRG